MSVEVKDLKKIENIGMFFIWNLSFLNIKI